MKLFASFVVVIAACIAAPASAVQMHGSVSVYKTGSGDGKVTSSPGGIDCDPYCEASFSEPNDVIELTATPFSGATFERWIDCPYPTGDRCTVVITGGSATVGAVFGGSRPPTYPLDVFKFENAGEGGTVTSDPPGISCGTVCSSQFATDSNVTLTAVPNAGSRFAGWSGAERDGCGMNQTCVVTMNRVRTVGAHFGDASPPREMPLIVRTTGGGIVTSTPSGIHCDPTCSGSFGTGTSVTLTAIAADGWVFGGWGGDCSGTGACVLTMDGPKSVSATFREQPPTMHALAVVKEGEGTVASDPGGIDCGVTCSRPFLAGTNVTLRAASAPGWRLVEWRGDCSGSAPTCSVVMAAPKSATAVFARLDVTAPAVRALSSSGRRGRTARLRYRVSDDSGSARVTVTVYRGRRALARIRRRHGAVNPNVLFYYVSWRVPRKLAKRPLRFCVAATDPSGNTTARQSCAVLRIS